ncbi:RNB domain-containing ribonuclease [Lentzea sp. DG1S-22]|uniref:RNB domain-containing ribonuclease n=1 Tax=Lentzea sp. DG1S-22 TaxID=3108822 RepID=UPI002E777FAC|nr:RNB domain-containing ribonuclease [Lentzea sp. DG1S-22]WVH77976.1 RNB domain-containing ribonuclease [Lentzea sp. DG1S-22]
MASLVIRTGRADVSFDGIRTEFGLPSSFPAAVLAEAEAAVSRDPGDRPDLTSIPLLTIDPPGAKDLDQALCVTKGPGGFTVHYAIADLGTFVTPGGPLDTEVRRRGQTLYLPDGNVPLHPTVLSEGAASLLPGVTRPAVLWTFECDAEGKPTSVDVRRALVRSTAQFDYAAVQESFDAGTPHPSVAALAEFGPLRRAYARERGAIELQLPEQEIESNGSGWRLVTRPRTEVDSWNAEISLMTGMAAAEIMIEAGVGILRTLPDPDPEAVKSLRKSAAALQVPWPGDLSPGAFLAGLDASTPEALALFTDATRLLRGAGYSAFHGELPELTTHAGVAAPYTHVTAPLRRLVDRFATEVCLAVTAGQDLPAWLAEALPQLPPLMGASDSLAAKVDRAALDQVEAQVLAGRVGQEFDAAVLRSNENDAEIFVAEPPVLAKCSGRNIPEGERIRVKLTEADPAERKVRFERA